MKCIGLLIGFLTVLVILLPLTAQDAKKDGDKKEDAKKDIKDAKKDPEKKEDKKKPPVEKLVYGGKFRTKIVGIKGDTNREYTIEVQEFDPVKAAAAQKWAFERQQQLAKQQYNALNQKDFNTRMAQLNQYQKDFYNFKVELAKQNVYTAKNMEVRATDAAKVRTLVPPIDFDDVGNQKKWTKKELDALRDKSPLLLYEGEKRIGLAPGYPSDFDAIKQGQNVDVYMVKVAAAKKDDTKKKKGPGDDDPPAAKDRVTEFMLLVILPDSK